MTRKVFILTVLLATALSGCLKDPELEQKQKTTDIYVSNDGNIVFSHASGLYTNGFQLTLSTDVSDGVIRYTTDGSNPTAQSTKFNGNIQIVDRTSDPNTLSELAASSSSGGNQRPGGGGIPGMGSSSSVPKEKVFKGTVIKAAVFSETGKIISGVSAQSYFVSATVLTRYGNLPFVSITTDKDNFFSSSSGIYRNSSRSGSDWERPVYFEMFEPNGKSVISQNMGVRISGGSTRSNAQKSLRFYCRDEYDENNKNINYELFKGLTKSYNNEILDKFKRILLRNSGNDNSSTLFRDALMHALVDNLNVDTQAARPCVAFLNGEFWGIYNIRERYDDRYFENHYDIDRDRVALFEISHTSRTPEVKEGNNSDLAHYNKVYSFFNSNSLKTETNYQKAKEYIDEDNLIDYFITNIYCGNTDWPANNNIFWRYKTDNGNFDEHAVWYMDGRYRWVIKDMDFGFALQGTVSHNTLLHAMNEGSSGMGMGAGGPSFTSAESTLFFRKLLENDTFKAKFITRFYDVINTNFETNRVVSVINSMKAERAPAITEHANRFSGSVSSYSSWESQINNLISFAQNRADYVRTHLKNKFNL